MTTRLAPSITDEEVASLPLGNARADLLRELLGSADVESETRPTGAPRWALAVVAAAAVLAVAGAIGLTQLNGHEQQGVVANPAPAGSPVFQVRTVSLTTAVAPLPDDPRWQQLEEFTCPTQPDSAPLDGTELACDDAGTKYLLHPAAFGVNKPAAVASQEGDGWIVQVLLDKDDADVLAGLTDRLAGTPAQIALVVNGVVISAPTVQSQITNGQLQLGGLLSMTEARDLVATLDR